ncbi:hypothetical protein [Flavobacterium algicola]|uniref:hypothetical protein n=1 Tax=Flavobacterium algicola TaxID=556529 RepID=UPI001EFD99D1|nr:hypothetical protein [Flavobacterium algicola]MCG9793326.1 hypothetical protein [Flavobacterium algicola]
MITNNIIAGLGGALVLNILNESLKGLDNKMPQIDLVGEEAVLKTSALLGMEIKDSTSLYRSALVSDIISNTLYYSLINNRGNKLWSTAASSGLMAGVGAVKLPNKMGLNDEPVAKSLVTKALTISYYVAGALTTAAILSLLDRKK